ncbi:MAG: hypothetical protein ACRDGS_05425, partial [Chloroflexota bacterium]
IRGVQVLCAAPSIGNLIALNLGRLAEFSHDGSGDAFAQAIASSPHLGQLEELFLPLDNIGDAGAAALAQSATLRRLRVLDLHYNKLGAVGASEIAASRSLMHLSRLYLEGNRLSEESKELLQARFGSALTL